MRLLAFRKRLYKKYAEKEIYMKKYFQYGIARSFQFFLLILEPYVYLYFLNQVIELGKWNLLYKVFFMYLCLFAVQTLVEFWIKWSYNHLFPEITLREKTRIWKKYTGLHVEEYKKRNIGEWRDILETDAEAVAVYKFKIFNMIFNALYVTGMAIVLLKLNWILAIFCFVSLPFSFGFTKYINGKNTKIYRELREVQSEYQNFVYQDFRNWKEIKLYGLEELEQQQHNSLWEKQGQLFIRTHLFWFLNRTFIAFKDVFLTKISLYLIGGILIVKGYAEVSVLLVFINYYEELINKVLAVSDTWSKIGQEKMHMDRLKEVLEVDDMNRKKEQCSDLDKVISVSVQNLFFGYQLCHRNVLTDVCMSLEKGRVTALVGQSGCGKSTVVKILTGQIIPNDGNIYVNGVKSSFGIILPVKMGIISQQSYIFNFSIRENLMLGNEYATEEEMEAVCKKANIWEYITALENGLDTVVGENGCKMSGGQRQRLILARTLLYNPDILFLDEATSALDTRNAKEFMDCILEYFQDKIVLIITHDYTIANRCDYIYYLQDGKMTDSGAPDKLNRNSQYMKMWGK